MSWDFWEKVRKADAKSSDPNRLARDARAGFAFSNESFLNSDLFRKASSTKCSSRADCGSGFACIGGTCTKVHTRNGGSWTPSGCGDDTITWVCTKGDKSGDNDSCTRPTPGNCDDNPDCPGERCCRQQLDGSIRCVCGPCDQTDTSTCNVYCDQQYKAFGVVRPGCYTRDMEGFGECGGNICDECQFCEDTGFGYGKCVQGEQDDPFNPLPCHCFPKCAEECHICNKDAGSPGFGECEYSPTNCQQCCTEYNYDCPQCAKVIPVAHHCEPVTSGKPCIQALREKLFKQCEAECLTDPCAPTGSHSYCVNGSAPVDPIANPGGPSGVNCPDGKTCQYTGYVEAGGKTCYLYSTWVTADIPPECEQCDCNCHEDCPDCQLCGADGKCYLDPECEAATVNVWLDTSVLRDQHGQCFSTFVCFKNQTVQDSRLLRSNVALEDARKWRLVTQPTGPINSNVKICTGTCLPSGDQFYCSGGTANCSTPDQQVFVLDQDDQFVASYDITRCHQIGYCNIRRWKETYDRNGTGSLRFEINP